MVNTNKVLTVSYGTFSCTLEGFDDSFETMKAIAEYFRDLAADDRYFGAEPPTPDAEMLARIAGREIDRRVDARMDRDRIVLRAAAPAPAAPVPPAVSDDLTDVWPDPSAASAVTQTEVMAVTPSAAATPESVAAKLDRIRAVVARAPEVVVDHIADQEVFAATITDIAADLSAAEPGVMSADALAAPQTLSADGDVGQVDLIDAPAVLAAAITAPQKVGTTAAATTAAVAAAMAGLRGDAQAAPDHAARADSDAGHDDLDYEDQDYEDADYVDADRDDTDHAGLDVGFDTVAEIRDVDSADGSDASDIDADIIPQTDAAATLILRDPLPADTAPAVAVVAEPATPAPAAQDDDLDSILARLMAKTARRSDAAPAEAAAAAMIPPAAPPAAPQITAASQEPAVPPLRARVMKMKRADFQAAVDNGLIAEEPAVVMQAAAAPATPAPSLPTSGSLSPEEEADLARELAAVEAELADLSGVTDVIAEDALDDDDIDLMDEALMAEDSVAPARSLFAVDDADEDDEDDTADLVAATVTPRVLPRHPLRLDGPLPAPTPERTPDPAPAREAGQRLADANADRDVMRLMAKTISEMDEPESTHRRSAIAHLRAAVAATKAEKQEGGVLKAEPSADPYRDDLASVVRPRRPVTDGGAMTRRPGDARPAPLKLVAEQRVDLPAQASAGAPMPVRPRRIAVTDAGTAARQPDQMASRAAPLIAAPDGGFSEFAEQVGARSLSDVLEAAASYLAFVEGQGEFSRPQLMTKVRQLGGAEYSREDGLRSFGMLLRDGKIEKLKGGRFTVSDRIGFRPDDRAAG